MKKGVLKNFAKFTGKHLCQALWHRCFPVNFAKVFKNTFLTEHLWWLFLFSESIDNHTQTRRGGSVSNFTFFSDF